MPEANCWPDLTDPAARTIVAQLASLGYHISAFRLPPSLLGTFPGGVELHAVDTAGDAVVVRQDEDGEADVELRAACLLAEQCSVELEAVRVLRHDVAEVGDHLPILVRIAVP